MPTTEHLAGKLARIVETAESILHELQELRTTLSDEQWENQLDSPFGDLLAYCLDLEHEFDEAP